MAKTNYSYEKRQKEIAKKLKQEQKRLKKTLPPNEHLADDASSAVTAEATPV